MDKDKVLSFMADLDKTKQERERRDAFTNSPEYKRARLADNANNAKDTALTYVMRGLYKSSLPLDSDFIKSNEIAIDDAFDKMANDEVMDKGIACYVTDGVKNGNTSLKELKEAVDRLIDSEAKSKSDNIDNLNIKDLDFKFDDDKKTILDQIAKDTDIDTIGDIIKTNVITSTEYEKERIKQRREEEEEMENQLKETSDDDTVSESVLAKKIALMKLTKPIYEMGLFESFMTKNVKLNNGNMNDAYTKAIMEYTFVNMTKALRVKQYTKDMVDNIIRKNKK